MALPEITVVNQHTVGKEVGEYIGRPSPLGNPYGWQDGHPEALKVEDRETAIICYEMWIQSHLRTGTPRIITELDRLASIAMQTGSLTLRCWCAPKACHGDVIKKVILQAIKDVQLESLRDPST